MTPKDPNATEQKPIACESCGKPFWLGSDIAKPATHAYPPIDIEALPLCEKCEEKELWKLK